jgi:hypothetical protein
MRLMVIDMHRNGINCRYLGIIRQHVINSNLRKSLLIGSSLLCALAEHSAS